MKEEVSRYANKFKCVQTKLFQINKSLQGQSTFIPINFDREYTSLAMATVHSSVIDFKFSGQLQNGPSILNSGKKIHSNDSEDDAETNHTFMENGILVEKKAKPDITENTEDGGSA